MAPGSVCPMPLPGAAVSLLTPRNSWDGSLRPPPDVTGVQVADLSLSLLSSHRATRAAPGSRARWESRGPEARRSVPRRAARPVTRSQMACRCCCLVVKSCLTLSDPMDCGPPGSSVRGILQARILEWIAISSSGGSSQPRDQTCVSCISCTGRWILYH